MKLAKILVGLLIFYLLLTFYPVFSFLLGRTPIWIITPLTTLLGFSIALLHSSQRAGWKRTGLLLGSVFVVSLAFESVGVATGLIYGPYHYTLKLGPLFRGLVPWLIPVAWFMMSYPSLVMADWLVPASGRRSLRWLSVAALGALIMTAWDTVMDPVMVAGGHWILDVKGAYFGIPLQNFLGWGLTVFVSFLVFFSLSGDSGRPVPSAFDRLMLFSYSITAAGVISVALLAGLGGQALTGLFAMLPWILLSWVRMADLADPAGRALP
jgi:putative membrane protein